MNREEIMNVIPHRDDMLLLDEAWTDEDGIAHGKYTVRGDEWFLKGHFPGNPVVPGVVLCEITAQASCVLIQNEIKGRTPYYAGIDKVRFRKMVRPGDMLEITAAYEKMYGKPFPNGMKRGLIDFGAENFVGKLHLAVVEIQLQRIGNAPQNHQVFFLHFVDILGNRQGILGQFRVGVAVLELGEQPVGFCHGIFNHCSIFVHPDDL